MKQISWIILGLLLLITAQAASFDCAKAQSKVEHFVCDDPRISLMDDVLSQNYKADLELSPRPETIRHEQLLWLEERNKCQDIKCIRQAYERRLATIRQQIPVSLYDLEVMKGKVGHGTKVGYCAGPPSSTYEHLSCTTNDTGQLIAKSRVVIGDVDFCTRLMKSSWYYQPLDLEHTIEDDEAEGYLSLAGASTYIAPYAGYFDINNDGKPEYLAWLTAYSGAGLGCDIETYIEMNRERSHLSKSPLTALIGANTCGTRQRAFRFENKIYIENRDTVADDNLDFRLPSILTEVYIFEDRNKRLVCTFHWDSNEQ